MSILLFLFIVILILIIVGALLGKISWDRAVVLGIVLLIIGLLAMFFSRTSLHL